MNRIYKSIYNAARRCVVCVSEIQSSRVKSKSERKETPVKPILSMLSAAVLVAMSSHAMAAPEPANLIQVGGIYYQYDADGKCTVYEPYETSKAINWNYTFSDDPEQTILDMRPTDHTLYNSLADGGTGSLTIKSGMTVTITGGTKTNAYAFENLATNAGSAAIINEGTLTIQGGTGSSAHGIYINADGRGSVGTISNTGTGSLTIKASQESSGIYQIANGGSDFNTSLDSYGKGKVENLVNGVMNIIGNESHSAIESLSGYTSAYASILPNFMKPTMAVAAIENSGVMNLNKYAIGEFNHIELCVGGNCHSGGGADVGRVSQKLEITGGGSFLNKSTGTVNAEAGAIFESTGQSEITVNTPIPITIYTPNEGTKVTELDSYGTSETTVTTGWKLKDDWYNYSTWEDGGKLVITDVVAGSAEAQTIIDSFQNRFGTGTAIEFTGTEVNTVSLTREGEAEKPAFTFEHVYELIDTGEVKNGSVITSEVLTGTVLATQNTLDPMTDTDPVDPGEPGEPEGPDPEGPIIGSRRTSLTVADDGDFNIDIGFKGLTDFRYVFVEDGKSLTLAGEQAEMTQALSTDWQNPTFKVVGAAVHVNDNSTLRLGVAELSATQGKVSGPVTLQTNESKLSVENGVFLIEGVVTGEGQIQVQEKGKLKIGNSFKANSLSNKGTFIATSYNTNIGQSSVQTFANETTNDVNEFVNDKGGQAYFSDVTVNEGANVKNKADAVMNAGAVVLNGGAAITNFADGTLNFDSFEMNGTLRNNGTINVGGEMSLAEGTTTTLAGKVTAGTFSIGRAAQKAQAASISTMADPETIAEITGETYSDVLDLAGGNVFVRKDAILAGIDLKDNIVNSKVTVDTDGTFAFSFNENQLESALKDLKLDREGKALAVLSTDLSFGETGSLTIGTTDATDTVNLGSDALVLLATDSLHGNAVLNGEGKETLNIKEGAELAFTDNAIWGNHYLVRDFVSMDAAENLTVKDLEGNVLETHYNDKGIYVTIGSTNILDKDAAFGLSNNINAIMDGQQNTLSALADIRYLSMAMGAKDGVKQTNDLQHLAAQAGVLSEAYRLTDNAHESIIRHAMSDKYSNVWVEALAGKGGIDGAGTGYGDASYDSDSYGMIFGLDGRIGQSINVGAAIHYQKGDLEADSSQTKNEFKNYGASVYAGTNFGNLNVTAGLTYAKGDHEFNQVNLGYVEGDTDTEVFMGGIRASYPIMLDRILITPYAGIEAVHVKEDGFKATIGGAEAFDFGSVSETFGRVPMGVKLSGGNAKFAGYADISVVPQFGNSDAKQSVSGVNTKATDVAKFDYADSVLGRVKMGAAYQVNKSTTLGVSYGASMGDVRDLSHEFSLNAKYRF